MSADATYGFNRADARELVAKIGSRERIGSRSSGTGVTFFVARLKEPWSAKAANCDIYTIDGATYTDTGNDATVYDPLSIFSVATTNDFLLVAKQGGKYYAVIAPCPA